MAGVPGIAEAGPGTGAELPPTPGSYALAFHNAATRTVRVGALGDVRIEPGFYVYVGSAFGPGGLRARVSRHVRLNKKHHWHIDYLRPHLNVYEAWWTNDTRRREHDWAARLERCMTPAYPRFGASDCTCGTHLFFSADRPDHHNIGATHVCPL